MGKTRHLNGTCGQLDSPSPSWFATEAANGNRLAPVYKKSGARQGGLGVEGGERNRWSESGGR